ncbi:O-antigen polymerase [Cedecea sp. NFIX57]|uniref:O-antigen polymerase n=1 Tax=Cedecea sp. NFIX57 TaxID=1566286 RepID=UPI000A0A96F8|nr:O-antigen polymerase [Cedecea sp. NFIX57]SMG26044.1 oligosaccharide repeat unit polymerase [Cedecea sp. NFIX57]
MDIILGLLFLILTFIPAFYLGALNFKTVNYYTLLFWFPMIFCVVGAFIIRSGIMDNTFFVQPIANNHAVKTVGLLITIFSFFVFFYACWFTEIFITLVSRKKIDPNVRWAEFSLRYTRETPSLLLCGITVTSLLLIIYYYSTISPAPLMMALTGASSDIVSLRRLEITKDYQGIGYFKTLALVLPCIVSYCYLIRYSIRKKKNTLIAFLFTTLISIFSLSLNGEKAPLIFYIIGLIVSYSTVRPVKKKVMLFLGLIIFLIILMLYIVLFQFSDSNYMLYIIIERIFVAQEISVFYAADYFTQHQFLGMSTLDNVFNKLFGITPGIRASELFMYYYLPVMAKNGGWNVNGFFSHESYSNFGYLGVILGAIYGGVVNALICRYFRSTIKTELVLGFYAFFAISVTSLLSSFNAMLFNTQLILVFIIFLCARLFDKGIKKCHM